MSLISHFILFSAVVNLTLIDLPGLTKVAVGKTLIRDIIGSFLDNSLTWMLLF